ncbi:MAG TPA: hypothetical protein VEZ12_24365 [Herpetosiphonaceae bacterium]|nr:hypothetical protein [Herpetosiphonaceae bacterium]
MPEPRGRLRQVWTPFTIRLGARCLLLILPLLALPAWGRAQETNRAGLVIVKGDGSVQTACVAFDEPTISGLALLERAGLDLVVQPAGSNATVCSIAGEGCAFPREACWCQCAGGGPCRYWSYWHRNGGAWQYSVTGAPLYQVPAGGVDAWVWGENRTGAASRPPEITFEAICPVPAALPPSATAQPRVLAPTATGPTATGPTATATKRAAIQATRTSAPRPKATTTRPRSQATRPRSTTSRAPAPAPSPSVQPPISYSSGSVDYMLFGGTAGVLLLAITLAWRRRR